MSTVASNLGNLGSIAVFAGIAGYAIYDHLTRKEAEQVEAEHRRNLRTLTESIEEAPLRSLPYTHGALLAEGEKLYAVAHGDLQELQTVGFVAGTAGVGLNLGLGVGVGGSKTNARMVNDLTSVSKGKLLATNKRIIFIGDYQSVSINLSELVSFSIIPIGISFSDGKTSAVVATHYNTEREVFNVIMQKVLKTFK